jgi:hypothetical protein
MAEIINNSNQNLHHKPNRKPNPWPHYPIQFTKPQSPQYQSQTCKTHSLTQSSAHYPKSPNLPSLPSHHGITNTIKVTVPPLPPLQFTSPLTHNSNRIPVLLPPARSAPPSTPKHRALCRTHPARLLCSPRG